MTEGDEALAQAERDEEWAFLVLVVWLLLLAFIVVVLVFSPWPWGAVVGLLAWTWGARGVFKDFSTSVERTQALRDVGDESGGRSRANVR